MTKKMERIIIELIRMDIINYNMASNLGNLNVNIDSYILGIDEVVFELLGIDVLPNVEEIFEEYFKLSKKALILDVIHDKVKIKKLAEELYLYLKAQKNN